MDLSQLKQKGHEKLSKLILTGPGKSYVKDCEGPMRMSTGISTICLQKITHPCIPQFSSTSLCTQGRRRVLEPVPGVM